MLEHASLWPVIPVEIEKRPTALGQTEVTFTQTPAAQNFLEIPGAHSVVQTSAIARTLEFKSKIALPGDGR
jgi:hypothetical protein